MLEALAEPHIHWLLQEELVAAILYLALLLLLAVAVAVVEQQC